MIRSLCVLYFKIPRPLLYRGRRLRIHVCARNLGGGGARFTRRRLLCGLVLLVDEESAPRSDQAAQHARDLGIQGLEANPLSPERKRPRE